ncbi:MAG: nucleotide exchange factor GrpE [Proteobacteria bacterium]|nr:nucleotide exchange factor GrpE [Pseudomonadota bacterium]NDD05691.1 nucleotide exchange factor GrpE [Pseudomonadota bacterium]
MESKTDKNKKANQDESMENGANDLTPGKEVPSANHEKAALDALELAKKEAEIAQKEMLYVRAEFDNYRKRILKEQEQAIKFANKNLITELLVVFDYFDRAIQHSKILKAMADPEVSNFVSGVEMSQHEFIQLLGRFGVELIGTIGEKFDPERHEAISQREVDTDAADTVLEVFQKGSLLNGRLLKPAKVVVGKLKN